MKHLMKISVFFAIIMMAFVSCEKDDDDLRDKFVGSYTSEYVTKVVLNIGGQKSEFSDTDKSIFTIEKSGSDVSKVIVKLDGESIEATVSGDKMTYTEHVAEEIDSLVLSGTGNAVGTIKGNVLTIEYSGNGVISGGLSGTFTITGTEIATKK
jgi:hypothetical protein